MAEYYQPTLEDFTIGLEYEFLTGGVEWKKFVFDMDRPQAVLENVRDYPDTFRVKHLDEEDIIELGAKEISNEYFVLNRHSIELHGEHKCVIENNANQVVFDGTIKNKSELLRILKQTGVIQ